MRRVVLESPFAGDVAENVAYAKRCMRHCLSLGEAPIASHLLWTQPGLLRDHNPVERNLGIEAGLAWHDVADAIVFYVDRAWSGGMDAALRNANRLGKPVEMRTLPNV